MWKIFDSGKKTAKENMAIDLSLLESLKIDDDPILHLYDWSHPFSATYGHFLQPEKIFNDTKLLDLAKRPTGGGVLFHTWDLAFSVLIPRNHNGYSEDIMKNYKFINDAVLIAVKKFLQSEGPMHLLPEDPIALDEYAQFFCFAKPTKYDVMFGGKKIAGAAQRRKKNGFLHQGSISIAMPSIAFLESIVPKNSRIIEAMLLHTFAPLPSEASEKEMIEARKSLQAHLQKTITAL